MLLNPMRKSIRTPDPLSQGNWHRLKGCPIILLFATHAMIRTFQITDIDFDLTLDDEDAWENDDPELLQQKLREGYIGRIFEIDLPDATDEEELADELLDLVSDSSGWCINMIDFQVISN